MIIRDGSRNYEVDPPLTLNLGVPFSVMQQISNEYRLFREKCIRIAGHYTRMRMDEFIPHAVKAVWLRANPRAARDEWIDAVAGQLERKYSISDRKARDIATRARREADRFS